jgi:hypothetical protein
MYVTISWIKNECDNDPYTVKEQDTLAMKRRGDQTRERKLKRTSWIRIKTELDRKSETKTTELNLKKDAKLCPSVQFMPKWSFFWSSSGYTRTR